MSRDRTSTNINTIYLINEQKSLQLIQDSSKLSSHILRVQDKASVYSKSDRKLFLAELELNIDGLEFIEKVKNEKFYDIKMVPAFFLRTICIRNLNELTPIIDLYYSLKNLTQDIKKIILVEDPKVPGLNAKICLVEYNSHQGAKKAFNIINSLNGYSNPYTKILCSSEKSTVEAVWCEPLKDNIKEILNNTPFCYFENMLINNYNLLEFKQFLEDKIKEYDCVIKKIRQFSNKIWVEFDKNVPFSLFDDPLYYEGKFIPVVPAMRPSHNVGKYRERHLKVSAQFLSEDDKKLLISRLVDSSVFPNEIIKKKAEFVYNKILQEEKKAKEKEREKERQERETSSSHVKRHRDKTEEYIERPRDRDIRDKKREKRERNKSEDKKTSTRESVSASNSTGTSLPISNYLSQISNLLLNNPNSSGLLSNLQNLSVLGNLQNLQNVLSNPALFSLLQLINPNNPSSTSQNPGSSTGINAPIASANSNLPITQQTPIKNIIGQRDSSVQNIPVQSATSAQINPIYNFQKTNMMDQQQSPQVFYNQASFPNQKASFFAHTGNPQNFPYGMPSDMYMNQMPYGNMPIQDYQGMDNVEMDNNIMMKKYYEYFQNMQQK